MKYYTNEVKSVSKWKPWSSEDGKHKIDVGVDAIQHYNQWYGTNAGVKPFYPISLDQLKMLMDTVKFVPVDHHGR